MRNHSAHFINRRLSLGCAAVAVMVTQCLTAVAAEKVTFNKDIRPILSDKCFACHGPDRTKLKGDLSLSVRDEAVAKSAITQGKPDESESNKIIYQLLFRA